MIKNLRICNSITKTVLKKENVQASNFVCGFKINIKTEKLHRKLAQFERENYPISIKNR